MPVSITTRIETGSVVLDVSGRLCFLEVGFLDRVNEMLEAGHRVFVLNLADVPYIDSFGLGQLIAHLEFNWKEVRSNDLTSTN